MIRLELHAASTAELYAQMAEMLAGRDSKPIDVVAPQPEQPPRRTRKSNAEAQPQSASVQGAVTDNTPSAPAPQSPSAEDASLAAGASAPVPALTIDIVRAKLMDVNKAKGMDAVKQILTDTGAGPKVSAIAEDKFAAVYAAAEKALP